jgi:disulfide bond formation protein DsbB
MSRDFLVRHRRAVSAAAGLFSLGLVACGFYLQHFQALEPCPLCIFQRMGLTALGVVLLLAAIPPARARWALRLGAVAVGLAALGTAAIALRHLYIQSQPPGTVPACGATLDYMMEVFPVADVVRKVLTGSGECAKVDWTFLGISMPGWVLIWAVVLGALGALANWPRRAAARA